MRIQNCTAWGWMIGVAAAVVLLLGCNKKEKECRQAFTYAKPLEEMIKKAFENKEYTKSEQSEFDKAHTEAALFAPSADEKIRGLWDNYQGQLYDHHLELATVMEGEAEMMEMLKKDRNADISGEAKILKENKAQLEKEVLTTDEYRSELEAHCGMSLSDI